MPNNCNNWIPPTVPSFIFCPFYFTLFRHVSLWFVFFALFIFILACFSLFRFHLVWVRIRSKNVIVSWNKPKQLRVSVGFGSNQNKKSVSQDTLLTIKMLFQNYSLIHFPNSKKRKTCQLLKPTHFSAGSDRTAGMKVSLMSATCATKD